MDTREPTSGDVGQAAGREHAATLPHLLVAITACATAASALSSLPRHWIGAWLAGTLLMAALRWRLPTLASAATVEGLAWGMAAAGLLERATATQAMLPYLIVATVVLLRGLSGAANLRLHLLFLGAACAPLLLASMRSADARLMPAAAFLTLCALGAVELARTRTRHVALARAEQLHRYEAEAKAAGLADRAARLQIEARGALELRERLEHEVEALGQELEMLRAKAGALSSVLQRVNPCDIETGLLTADKFENVLRREWARMQRQESPLSLLLCSVDRFDEFRDWHGPAAFEAALKRLGDVFRSAGQRPGDVAARLGPGLFALLFPETEYKYVDRLADGVRARVRQLGIAAAPSSPHKLLTVTVGMATVIPGSDLEPDVLRERVEAALYEAQFQGGDRCVRYRTFQSIRIEHWDAVNDGPLTEDKLRSKLVMLGYAAEPRVYRPGQAQPSRRMPVDRVEAIVEGKLQVALEGEAWVLQPGDFLFIPKGLVTSVEVVGQRPVRALQALSELSRAPVTAVP